MAAISSLQTFDSVYILTKNGGPQDATRTIVIHVYDLGFHRFEFGASSAAALEAMWMEKVRRFMPVWTEVMGFMDGRLGIRRACRMRCRASSLILCSKLFEKILNPDQAREVESVRIPPHH